jgi:hypothetical protein
MKKDSFEEKELQILREAIDSATSMSGKKLAQSDEVKEIIDILEQFLRTHMTLCYGGTAVNNILPEQHRFYNRNIEIPDYDFFTPHAMDYAKKLADIYYSKGYTEVEAKSGIHTGTFKVFVNFMPIADITQLEAQLFKNLSKKAIKINAINYCPPNYLRMAMYQELSRPMGDVSRWEKVLKRLILLNKNFPLKGEACNKQDFQRKYEGPVDERDQIYEIAKTSFINQGLVFFGGYAASLYGKYMPRSEKQVVDSVPDFDILSEDPLSSATILQEQLIYEGYKNVNINKKNEIGEYVDIHYEVVVNKDIIAYIYKANACHSYNIIYINEQKVKVATIDTMLTFYLIFIYANRRYYDENRLLCMSEYLFKVQLKNRLQQKGLLRRFSINCFGKQQTLEDIRGEKSRRLKELIGQNKRRGDKTYDYYFLRHVPADIDRKMLSSEKAKSNTNTKIKSKTKTRFGKKNKKPKAKAKSVKKK